MMNTFGFIGTTKQQDAVVFQMEAGKTSQDCAVVIFDAETKEQKAVLPFPETGRTGLVHTVTYPAENAGKIAYCFQNDGKMVPDIYAKAFLPREYGSDFAKEELLAVVPDMEYDWGNDTVLGIPYEDCLFYELHVRGFTMDASSKVKEKGTFLGLSRKIPYLHDIGVTSVVFQPMYEFLEKEVTDYTKEFSFFQEKINYWGYKEGFYFAPKSAYAYTKDCVKECKDMIKALHANGIEAIMQMYFPREINRNSILAALAFWAAEYHVDGFMLMGEDLPMEFLKTHPLLADRKLLFDGFFEGAMQDTREYANRYLGVLRPEYQSALRKFLKGDENTLEEALYQMRSMDAGHGIVKYFTRYQGFTLYDMVCYGYKHNEFNGEENRDGTDYNCSWNCGEEGDSRKKKIKELRIRQIKNAFLLLMCSAGTPMIFMGDEFGNSQGGNNNPYCQDNAVAWLNWKKQARSEEIFNAFRFAVSLRQQFKLFRPAKAYCMADTISCGYPDVSYHGDAAWKIQFNGYNRHAGILYCGEYAKTDKEAGEDYYIAVNMHWDRQMLSIPNLPAGRLWTFYYSTGNSNVQDIMVQADKMVLPARTICVLKSIPDPHFKQVKVKKKAGKKQS